jgi:hypothetical protein
MRWLAATSLCSALLLSLNGCRSCSPVEAELRARESDVRELHERLDRAEFHNQSLMRELCALRGLPGPSGAIEPPSEPFPVRCLALGRQTGGLPSDTLPADEGLRVQVEPRDPEGQAIKAPGTLIVEAQEITPEGLKRSLSAWQVPPQILRTRWISGLITTGYSVCLPWKVWPGTERIRVIARFQMLDGRVFEADKDVTIRILPENKRKSLPLPAPATETPLPPAPIPFTPPPSPPEPEKPPPDSPEPKSILPAPLPQAPLPPPMPVEPDGPKLLQGRPTDAGPIKVEMLRPTPLQPE